MEQTRISQRTPLWFKELLREWDSAKNHNLGLDEINNLQNWVCSCEKFRQSTFFLCGHLITNSNVHPKFYNDLEINDAYPLMKFKVVDALLQER
jgi:hypothetical protein